MAEEVVWFPDDVDMDRCVVPDVSDLVEGLVHEDEGNENGEALLGEAGDVADHGTEVEGHDEQQGHADPDPNPESESQEIQSVVAEIVHNIRILKSSYSVFSKNVIESTHGVSVFVVFLTLRTPITRKSA